MKDKKEFEVVRHTTMNYLEIFIIEMTARSLHGHEDLEIGILLNGSVTLFIDQGQHQLRTGDIYIINRYQVHSFLNASDCTQILAFQLRTDFYRKIDPQLGFLFLEGNIIRSGFLYKNLYQQLFCCAEYYFTRPLHYELKCSSLLFELLYEILTNSHYLFFDAREATITQNNSLRLNRITDYMNEHHSENISLQDIADLENITPYHASHFIKKMLGISFQEYLNNIRFEHALLLIEKSDLTILDICLETGFSSSRYLNQMFEKMFGCTTKEYLKMPEKPYLTDMALPIENIQKRYSFEKSAFIFKRYKDSLQL